MWWWWCVGGWGRELIRTGAHREMGCVGGAWPSQDKMKPSAIAKLLKRDKSSITRLVVKAAPRKKQGRTPTLSPEKIDALVGRAGAMIRKADGNYQVTAAMLKKSLRIKACDRVILDALHSRGLYLKPMREKPVLTDEDVKQRKAGRPLLHSRRSRNSNHLETSFFRLFDCLHFARA